VNEENGMQDKAKLNMHQMFLEALRHREQDIIRFLAILGPSLGGFIWLLGDVTHNPARFVAGTYGVLLVLVLGAFYSLALGYNYRYLTLQLAKLESKDHINLEDTVLAYWPRQLAHFRERSRWGIIPWCTPPGIIKVFWIAFLACILGVTITATCVRIEPPTKPPNATTAQPTTQAVGEEGKQEEKRKAPRRARRKAGRRARREAKREESRKAMEQMQSFKDAIPWVGGVGFLLAVLWPVTVGRKMLQVCKAELLEW